MILISIYFTFRTINVDKFRLIKYKVRLNNLTSKLLLLLMSQRYKSRFKLINTISSLFKFDIDINLSATDSLVDNKDDKLLIENRSVINKLFSIAINGPLT